MFVNSSSASEDSQAFPCSTFKISISIMNGINGIKILLILPLCSYVTFLGYQRWRQQRSLEKASHSDVFAYHLAVMELIGLLGSFLFLGGVNTNNFMILTAGMFISLLTFYGELFFNLLTCVERYLAVVHPIFYRGLRSTRGVRIRNITIGWVWLLCFGMMILETTVAPNYNVVMYHCIVVSSILVISFSSISVLCALLRPGPGEGVRKKEGVDQSKLRAFYTITVTSTVVWLWFLVLLIQGAVSSSTLLSDIYKCLIHVAIGYLNLPCSLVSPLLYLHKHRKLLFCRA